MASYSGKESAVVAASPEACFVALTDYERLPQWQSSLKRVTVVEDVAMARARAARSPRATPRST